MRVLIVGGGLAGLTLAAKLRRQGRHPVVIEKADRYGDAGYGIGLYPLGSCVLHGLGAYAEFAARGVEARRYEIADRTGAIMQHLDLSLLTDNAGPMMTLPRTDLVEVLRKTCDGVEFRMGTTIEELEQNDAGVWVRFHTGGAEEFDLIAACDGMNSQTRAQVFGEPEVFETGCTAWTWWGRAGLFADDLVREYWGRGFFFGAYPVPGRCMFVTALPNEAVGESTSEEAARPAVATALAELMRHDSAVRHAFEDAATLYAWPMRDIRAPNWFKGRVVSTE